MAEKQIPRFARNDNGATNANRRRIVYYSTMYLAAFLLLEILTTGLPDAVVGRAYRAHLQAAGGSANHFWHVNPPLPPGLSLDSRTGEIGGIPRRPGVYEFTAGVIEEGGRPVERDLRLKVVAPLEIITAELPPATVPDGEYRLQLRARGGTRPFRWRIASGRLPASLRLDPQGFIYGKVVQPAELQIILAVTDSGSPPQTGVRSFGLDSSQALAVMWKQLPELRNGGIFGSVEATNRTEQVFDLTILVVTVNEYNKAFTLGYQRYQLPPGAATPETPFGFTLPRGRYMAHVTAVAEVPPRTIYRAYRKLEGLRVP